jgi:hypothetical protein
VSVRACEAVTGVTGGIKADTPCRRANGESSGPLREHGPDIFPACPKELPRKNEKLPEMGSWSQLNPTGTRSRLLWPADATGPCTTTRSQDSISTSG